MNGEANSSKLARLADVLLVHTRLGNVTWVTTDVATRFMYTGSRSSVWIEGKPDKDGDWFGALTVLDESGDVVESLSSAYEREGSDDEVAWQPIGSTAVLKELHDEARRSALNIDGVIDQLIKDLEEMPPF